MGLLILNYNYQKAKCKLYPSAEKENPNHCAGIGPMA